MKKFNKKSIRLIFIIFMCIIALTSCNNDTAANNASNENPVSDGGMTSENSQAETTTKELKDDIPDITFNGETINILEYDISEGYYFITGEIYSEGENGELINDAVYRRNLRIEDRFDIKINVILSGTGIGTQAAKSIKADDGAYDIISTIFVELPTLVSQNMLAELKTTIPYVDFTRPWWDQRATDDLSIGGKLFMNVSTCNITAINHTYTVIFNKTLIAEYELENPYQLVRDGGWTLDKMYSMIKIFNPRDLDGDGVMGEKDLYGLLLNYSNASAMLIASGENLISKDRDDMPYVSMNTQRATDVLDKIFDIISDKSITMHAQYFYGTHSDPWEMVQFPTFREDRALFFINDVSGAIRVRGMSSDFGIVPMPKYDTQQKEYYNSITPYGASAQAVAITNDKLEVTGALMEALAYESYKYVVPAFYETTLKNKMLRDEESIEMLDLLSKTRTYDAGMIYNWGDCMGFYYQLAEKGGQDFVSSYEKVEARIIKAVETAIDDVLKE